MRNLIGLSLLLISINLSSQDSIQSVTTPRTATDYIWIFSSPRLINANTVEMVPRGILEFKVTHNFGDIAGDLGGIKNFFGLDGATDIRIGFQYGVSNKINLIAARSKGMNLVRQLYELGFKYRFLQQANDSRHPISAALFANAVVSTITANVNPDRENSFDNFSDRLSQTVQLMIGRKLGKVSLQLNPTMVHTNYVVPGDEKTLLALGGAMRIPVKGRFSLLADYFHTFRSQSSKDMFEAQNTRFYDVLGVGVELLTEGHVFHLNFTNATEILENRFIPRTTTSWGKGQYRWGFTVSRDFDMIRKKRSGK